MPDQEILEEGVLSPVETEVQDPLLRGLLAENESIVAPTEQEQPRKVAAPTDEVDCVVIGTGAGGAPLLLPLPQLRSLCIGQAHVHSTSVVLFGQLSCNSLRDGYNSINS